MVFISNLKGMCSFYISCLTFCTISINFGLFFSYLFTFLFDRHGFIQFAAPEEAKKAIKQTDGVFQSSLLLRSSSMRLWSGRLLRS